MERIGIRDDQQERAARDRRDGRDGIAVLDRDVEDLPRHRREHAGVLELYRERLDGGFIPCHGRGGALDACLRPLVLLRGNRAGAYERAGAVEVEAGVAQLDARLLEPRARLGGLRLDQLAVDLEEEGVLRDLVAVVHVHVLDDAGDAGPDLHLLLGLDRPGRHDDALDAAALGPRGGADLRRRLAGAGCQEEQGQEPIRRRAHRRQTAGSVSNSWTQAADDHARRRRTLPSTEHPW